MAHLITIAVEHHHLPIKTVKSSYPKVTVAQQFTNCHFAIVHTVEQLRHKTGLEDLVTEYGFTIELSRLICHRFAFFPVHARYQKPTGASFSSIFYACFWMLTT